AAEIPHRLLDALVAALDPHPVAQAGGAHAVRGRDEDALAMIDHEALGIGEGQLDPPPAPHRLADLADDLKLAENALALCKRSGHLPPNRAAAARLLRRPRRLRGRAAYRRSTPRSRASPPADCTRARSAACAAGSRTSPAS